MEIIGFIRCEGITEKEAQTISEFYIEFLELCNLLKDDEQLRYFFVGNGAIIFFKEKMPFVDIPVRTNTSIN